MKETNRDVRAAGQGADNKRVLVEGARLFLRDSTFADCAVFAEWEKMPAVTRFFTIDRDRAYEDVVTEFVQRRQDSSYEQLTICLREDEAPIGRLLLSRIDPHYDSLDITRIYIADPALRGKGFGEEALRLALAYGFEMLGMERITLDFFTGNTIASTLYRKVGFVAEGCMRHAGKKDGVYVDLNLMSMLRSEYFARL